MNDFKNDNRFKGIEPFKKKVLLASPTMHKIEHADGSYTWKELEYVRDAFEKNWITCAGENIEEYERLTREYLGAENVVGLSCGTATIHLAVKLAAQKLYGSSSGISTPDGLGKGGSLHGRRAFLHRYDI